MVTLPISALQRASSITRLHLHAMQEQLRAAARSAACCASLCVQRSVDVQTRPYIRWKQAVSSSLCFTPVLLVFRRQDPAPADSSTSTMCDTQQSQFKALILAVAVSFESMISQPSLLFVGLARLRLSIRMNTCAILSCVLYVATSHYSRTANQKVVCAC